MGNFGIRKNASGYRDDPCYHAVASGPQPGEIWTNRKGELPSLILANNGPLCLCLKLYEDWQEGEIRVMGRVPMYANPLKVTYARTQDLTTYVKSIPAPEFKVIHRACVRALGTVKE